MGVEFVELRARRISRRTEIVKGYTWERKEYKGEGEHGCGFWRIMMVFCGRRERDLRVFVWFARGIEDCDYRTRGVCGLQPIGSGCQVEKKR